MLKVLAVVAAMAAGVALASDPAPGWMAYAAGVNPNGNGSIITHAEAKWQVPSNPAVGGAFFSPWFGIETSDNLNLFQPVNPWTGSSWSFYIEYFQWTPTHNQDSKMLSIQAGDILHGVVTYNQGQNSYTATHTNLNTTQSVSMTINVQKDSSGSYKQYTIMYVVMEKSQWNCDQYPANGIVTFFDIDLEYNGQPVNPSWTTSYVDDVCSCRAHVVAEDTISITWST